MPDVKDVMTISTSIPLATDVLEEFVPEMKLFKLMDPAELAQNTTNHPKMDLHVSDMLVQTIMKDFYQTEFARELFVVSEKSWFQLKDQHSLDVLSVEVANTQIVIKESAFTHSANLDSNFLRTEHAETANQTRTFSQMVSHQSTPVTALEECVRRSHAVKIKLS